MALIDNHPKVKKGRAMRERREALGLTRAQLAVLVGVSTNTIGHAEAGAWSTRTALGIESALDQYERDNTSTEAA